MRLERAPRERDATARIEVRGPWPKDRERQLELVWTQVQKECALVDGSIQDNCLTMRVHGVGRSPGEQATSLDFEDAFER